MAAAVEHDEGGLLSGFRVEEQQVAGVVDDELRLVDETRGVGSFAARELAELARRYALRSGIDAIQAGASVRADCQ